MVRKTINVDDFVNRLINVVIAKTLLDAEIEISYRDAVNSILLLGLSKLTKPKNWRTFTDEYLEEYVGMLEDQLRQSKFTEDVEEFFDYFSSYSSEGESDE